MAEVRVEHVWKFYQGEKGAAQRVEAVKDATFTCNDKEFLCLLGPSGCGKTSTLRMIAGLEKISQGDIYIGEKRVNDLLPKDRMLAMSFESYALYPPMTIYENIAFPLRARNWSEDRIRERIKEVSELLEIQDILSFRPAKLSGGEQQRVSLARALVREDAQVTLMDEPISHLDAQLKARLRIDLKRVQREWGLTVIYVTHDQLEALSMADKVVVMNLGEIQQVGTPEDLYQKPANLFVAGFIGEPPMNFLPCSLMKDKDHFYLQFSQFRFEVDSDIAQIMSKENNPKNSWTLGVRPADMIVGSSISDGYSLKAHVFSVEHLGESSVVTVDIDGQQILIEVPGLSSEKEGDLTLVSFGKEKAHIFNALTGKVIRK
ncbi:MAG: multiple sugar transport system ATP-binding protein [Candidatus Atribacteria bacterium]|nr:multiple sugar transport system ATP-binding protein [Candidatus Atribacteria bacterium]